MMPVDSLMEFFRSGGFFMFPIAIVCIVGCIITSERIAFLTYTAIRGKRVWRRVLPQLEQERFDQAAHIAVSARCAMGDMICHGLQRLHVGRRRDDIDRAMEESLERILPRLERHTHYLVKFANVAILLGLLGTLVGFIGVFATASELSPADQATLFADGIAGSVTPAAFGLIVAIPLLLIHTFLQTLASDLMDHFELVAGSFADHIVAIRRRGVQRPKPALRLVAKTPSTASG